MKNLHPHRPLHLLVALFIGLCLTFTASAQSLAYVLKITRTGTSTIDGLSTMEGYNNQIEVASYSFSGNTPVTLGTGGNPTISRFVFSGVECVLTLDGKAYPRLLIEQAAGRTLSEIILTGVNLNGETTREFFKLEMKNTFIETISQQGTNGDQPIVNILFRPSSIRLTTNYLNADGSTSDPIVFQWNLVANNATY